MKLDTAPLSEKKLLSVVEKLNLPIQKPNRILIYHRKTWLYGRMKKI